MVFLAGVDEAGYGPLLGPLTVGYSAFRVPDPDTDLWTTMQRCVARKSGRDGRHLVVDDSKRVHSGRLGRGRLARSVAAFRELLVPGGGGLAEWLQEPPAGNASWYAETPWFAELGGPLVTGAAHDRTRLDAAALHRELGRGGATLLGFGARAVPAVEWNALLETCGGKGSALFRVTMEVVRHLLAATGDAPLRVELDRHGARARYRDILRHALRPDAITVHAEGPRGSSYTLQFGPRSVQLRFSEAADASHFPTALASLAAKHTRERLMDLWNDWFAARLPHVRPTKGYAVDARRWLQEAGPHLGELGVERLRLERQR